MKTFDEQGRVVDAPENPVFNDLMQAPIIEQIGEDVIYVAVVVRAENGMLRLALALPTLIATTDEVLAKITEAVAVARQEFVEAGIVRDQLQQQQIEALQGLSATQQQTNQMLAAHDAALAAVNAAQDQLIAQLQARKQFVALPDAPVAAAQLITLTAGEKSFTVDVAGLQTTDTLIVTPKTLPAGYGLRSWTIPQAGKLTLRVQCPVLSVGGTALNFGVSAFR
jgi:hypothetical protein